MDSSGEIRRHQMRENASGARSGAGHMARVIRRRVLHDVKAVANTWARARTPAPTPASVVFLRGGDNEGGAPWPAFPPRGYLGQLDPAFQAKLASERASVELEDCSFYHTASLSNGDVVRGPWDLRGAESAYLGNINVAGDRVLELGPATGALTYYMEDEGAEVVSFDIGFDVCADILPKPGVDEREQQMSFMGMVAQVQNSWWYLHKDRGSRAKVAYGNIYDMPGDLGTFDTSVFGAILLHLRDPFLALQQAAARTSRRIVVTDALQDPTLNRDDNLLRFASAGFDNLTIWWTLTPGTVQRMLRHLGFDRLTTTYSSHLHYLAHDMTKEPVEMAMFTVVGERSP
jgi:hypothetical protein